METLITASSNTDYREKSSRDPNKKRSGKCGEVGEYLAGYFECKRGSGSLDNHLQLSEAPSLTTSHVYVALDDTCRNLSRSTSTYAPENRQNMPLLFI